MAILATSAGPGTTPCLASNAHRAMTTTRPPRMTRPNRWNSESQKSPLRGLVGVLEAAGVLELVPSLEAAPAPPSWSDKLGLDAEPVTEGHTPARADWIFDQAPAFKALSRSPPPVAVE